MDRAFQHDRRYLQMTAQWGSCWAVRKARRQLMRRWARRYSSRYGVRSWLNYCEYVKRDGFYGAPWVAPEVVG